MFTPMDVKKTVEGLMCVKRLFKEIQADAPFRNHTYMFEKDADFNISTKKSTSLNV